MVHNSWMAMRRGPLQPIFCSGHSLLYPAVYIHYACRNTVLRLLIPWETLKLNNFSSYWGKNDSVPSRETFYMRSQAKRAGGDLVWIHIKLESRVKRVWLQDPPWILRKSGSRCSKLGLVSESPKLWILPITNVGKSNLHLEPLLCLGIGCFSFLYAASLMFDGNWTQNGYT